MKISHVFGKDQISKYVSEDTFFLLNNNFGDFLLLSSDNSIKSRYEGLNYLMKNGIYKTISSIHLDTQENVTEVINNFNFIVRKYETIQEKFYLPPIEGTLVYELDKKNSIFLDLDFRYAYENPEFGRVYNISKEKDCIIIEYLQKDQNEKNNLKLYLAIYGSDDYSEINNWIKQEYSLDKERGSWPWEKHIFVALKLRGKRFSFAVSEDKNNAIKRTKNAHLGFLTRKKIVFEKSNDIEKSFALYATKNSLSNLIVDIKDKLGVYAGIPWFFQFWTRDEVISAKAISIINSDHENLIKQILLNKLKYLQADGKLLNIIEDKNSNSSSDATGWLFFRLMQMKLSEKERLIVKTALIKSLNAQLKNSAQNDLAYSAALGTWMDTSSDPEKKIDTRDGFPIEIQALRLANYALAYELTKNQKWKNLENRLKQIVREKYWNGKYLHDNVDSLGNHDSNIRPNIFIAYYVYPNLLTNYEWEKCFDNILPDLWLNWGGFSTIDIHSSLFKNEHSGENPISYHRGDSWFWINNLAAICLYRINKKKYDYYIKKILNASINDILWKGIIGNASELSSAKEQKAQGSLCQAWSNAMFIELIEEFKK